MVSVLSIIMLCSISICSGKSYAALPGVMKGKVADIQGGSVEGAEIFVYNSPKIRRPADFISPKTDKLGKFEINLPAGKYWVVARVRRGGDYGPLMPGDKHSFETKEIELIAGAELYVDFVVADIKESVSSRAWSKENHFKTEGRVLDENSTPVDMAYVFANRSKDASGLPDYISAWTDKDGRYSINLPKGKYFIGTATEFPPGQSYLIFKEIVIDKDNADLDVIRTSGKAEKIGK